MLCYIEVSFYSGKLTFSFSHNCKESRCCYEQILQSWSVFPFFSFFKPLIPMSDWDRISPYNINTNQEDKWWEPRKVYIRLLLVDPIPNSQTYGLQVTFSNNVNYCELARKAGFQVFIIFHLITTCIITLLSINLTCTPIISHSTCIMYLLP